MEDESGFGEWSFLNFILTQKENESWILVFGMPEDFTEEHSRVR